VTATENEDQVMVEMLFTHGADINMTSTHDMSGNALWSAASRGLQLTKLLVDNGADVNIVCASGTALSAASGENDQSVIKFLLERGARIDAIDNSNCTALRTASRHGYIESVELLVAKGADVNIPSDHTTPLIAAARFGHTDIMAILIDAGADVNARNSGALLDALQSGQEHAVAFLEAKGAKKLTLKRLTDAFVEVCNPRIYRFRAHDFDREKAFKVLLDRGADVNAYDSSAVLDALRYGHKETVALLEAKGANKPTLEQLTDVLIEVRGHPGRWHFESAVQMLLDRGADDNAANPETSLID
jgi:ankyrin repeat protein